MNERYLKYREKINTRYLVDTILNASYLCDKTNSLFKPELSEDELNSLLITKETIKANKQKIFNNLVWYAAYFSQQVYFKRYMILYKNVEYSEYLQFALERLWFCLDKYDAEPFNCSIYTYVLNDYRFRIRNHIGDEYSALGIKHNATVDRYKSILKGLIIENQDIKDIINMTDEKFESIYGENRKKFLCYIAGINVISLDTFLDPTVKNSGTIGDTYLSDPYSEKMYRIIDARFTINDIESAVLKRFKHHRNIYRDLKIYEEYAMTNITLRELARRYGLTFEAIRQILRRFEFKLKQMNKYRRLNEEENEI